VNALEMPRLDPDNFARWHDGAGPS
jgi:hypothetical protein